MDEKQKTEQEVFIKMAQLCSKSEQCSPEIIKKIREYGFDSILIQSVLDRLEKENFLNDKRYVSLYVSDKFRVNKWGRVKISYYLKMKGLKEGLIQSGLREIDEEEYVKLLVQTMKEKAKSVRGDNKYEKMGHVIRFTQSRGFEPELIHRYLNEAMV